ncbi:hypothetical protein V496_09268 [Pseudogymnoascus sp. VKM F-4515 (FW-2607)]|nr:hypothetical protein V496_09268 [Pseudogymnoascus sp. VKM F-4515 (FW-2607)]KFY76780.1 hypothetical protein V498_09503 [Pseudogymnoascus sp. VKM F-4517 (FW-2822)]
MALTSHLPRIKTGLHGAQALFTLVAACITIAYMTKRSRNGGSIQWYLALCFLSIPPMIYNSMTLLFARSRNWGNAYVFAALDVVFAILWLSAFAAVAAWTNHGYCFGACSLSKAMAGVGFFVFALWVLTSAISVYGAIYYRNHGSLPGARIPNNAAMIDPDREAFSTTPHDDEYAPVHGNDKDELDRLGRFDSELAGGSSSHPFEPASYDNAYARPGADDDEHESPYSGGYRPSTVQPDTDTSYGGAAAGRAQFPNAPY